MMDSIKDIELIGNFKSDKIYYLYKTSSSEINLEILSHFQKYESSLDFFSYYTKNNIKNLTKSVKHLYKNLISILNDDSHNFSSNRDKYISQISKIILTLNFILKTKEILNKLLIKSKRCLNGISNNFKIGNIYNDKLLSLIDNLKYKLSNDISLFNKNFSRVSTEESSCSSLNLWNKIPSQKQIQIEDDEIQGKFFSEKKLSIVNEEILSDLQTPAFVEKKSSNVNFNNTSFNEFNNNDSNDNGLDLSFRDTIFILDSDLKTNDNYTTEKKSKLIEGKAYDKNILPFLNDNINKDRSVWVKNESNNKLLDKKVKIEMYKSFLLLVKKLYKLCLITAEERIEIKKLIISKPRKIIDFYIKEYENIKDDYLKSAKAIKNLL